VVQSTAPKRPRVAQAQNLLADGEVKMIVLTRRAALGYQAQAA
jgi:hypothetical protein